MTTTQKPFVLAVGAAGQFAGLVVPELKQRGVRVRGFVRDPATWVLDREGSPRRALKGDRNDESSRRRFGSGPPRA